MPGIGGLIAAFEDGIVSNEQWRCTNEKEDKWMRKKKPGGDQHWPFAAVQAVDCCPWRDKNHKWGRLNAHWIGPKNVTRLYTDLGQWYCRYTVRLQVYQTVQDGSALTESP